MMFVFMLKANKTQFYVVGYQNTVHKDKFLFMAMEVANV